MSSSVQYPQDVVDEHAVWVFYNGLKTQRDLLIEYGLRTGRLKLSPEVLASLTTDFIVAPPSHP